MLLPALLLGLILAPTALGQSSRKEANTRSAPGTSEGQQTPSGKQLFQEHCAACHFTETTAQKIGPGLKSLYLRLSFSDGKKVTDASLAMWIEAGGKDMPGFKERLNAGQIRALISYIRTL